MTALFGGRAHGLRQELRQTRDVVIAEHHDIDATAIRGILVPDAQAAE